MGYYFARPKPVVACSCIRPPVDLMFRIFRGYIGSGLERDCIIFMNSYWSFVGISARSLPVYLRAVMIYVPLLL